MRDLKLLGQIPNKFVFRGAGGSKGRTSWQAKSETEDYKSFAAFLVYYIEALRAAPLRTRSSAHSGLNSSVIVPAGTLSPDPDGQSQGITLILGGYSYGSLVASNLPATEDILHRFQAPTKGSAESEIRLRAASLAAKWNKDARLYLEAQRARRSASQEKLKVSVHSLAVAMGGDESEQGSKRPSQESRRSLEVVRRSMDRSKRKLGFRQHSSSSDSADCAVVEESMKATSIALPRTFYLLISPVLPPASMFLTMFSGLRSDKSHECVGKFVENPTLAVYGDDDFFTSWKRLRRWAENLRTAPGSRFQFHEVSGAGHFWHEEGVDKQMRKCIRDWMQGFVDWQSSDR